MAEQRNRKAPRKSDTGFVALVSGVIVLAIVIGVIIGAGAYVAGRKTIYPNITVAGVDVGGMTYETARSTLLSSNVGIPTGIQATAVLTANDSVSVTSDEAGLTLPITEAVDLAYSYGRNGNFFKNLGSFIGCITQTHEVYSERALNESGVRAKIAQAAKLANHTAQEPSYEVTASELFITRGASGYTVDEEAVFEFIRTTLLSGVSRTTEEFSEANTSDDAGGEPDLEAIYNEVYREPENARIDQTTGQVVASVKGVSFNMETAKTLLDEAGPGQTVRIPLIFTEPEVDAGTVKDLLFKDKLAEKDTTLATSSANRITNITLAAAAINGFVMNPGEEFDFNKVVGQRTAAKGYKSAGAYAGGKHVESLGGGICQVSSTIYYCTLKADLETVERTNHGYTVSYLPAGLDATVSWPNLNFRFKNNKNYPVKIVCWVENKKLYVELWGTKENDYRVELESNIISRKDYETVEEVDESLKPGQRKTANSGQVGITSEAYKLIYDGQGNLISRTLISKDTYRPMTKIVLVGPKDTTTGGDTTGGDTTGGDTTGGDTTGGDTAGGDTTGGDTTGGDTAGGDTAGGDTTGGDTAGGDTTGGDTTGGDTPGGDTSDGGDSEMDGSGGVTVAG